MLFGHVERLHTKSTSGFEHFVTGMWFLAAIIAVVLISWWIYAKRWRLGGTLGILFVSGVLTYRLAPALAAVVISLGFALALLSTLSSLQRPTTNQPNKDISEPDKRTPPKP